MRRAGSVASANPHPPPCFELRSLAFGTVTACASRLRIEADEAGRSMRIVKRQTTYWDFQDDHGVRRFHFIGKAEQHISETEVAEFTVVTEHPVLIDYEHAWRTIYLGAHGLDPESVLAHLALLVSAEVGPWRPLAHYLNPDVDALLLLRSGHGMIARAPEPLAVPIFTYLVQAGFRPTSHLEVAMRPPSMSALVAGGNFVVARQFRIEALS